MPNIYIWKHNCATQPFPKTAAYLYLECQNKSTKKNYQLSYNEKFQDKELIGEKYRIY